MNDQERTAWIDAYLTGNLPEADRRAVESQLATDADFRREVDLQRALGEQLQLRGERELRDKMRQWDTENVHPEASVRPLPVARYTVWLVAASLTVGVLAAVWIWQNQAQEPVLQEKSAVRLPVELANPGSLGFAGDSAVLDSVWVRVKTEPAYSKHYRFIGDSLDVFSKTIPPERLRLHFDARTGQYLLSLPDDTTTYRLERGFRRVRPLTR